MIHIRRSTLATTILAAASFGCARQRSVVAPTAVAPTTAPAISAADLRTRLYIFADDSMMGREAGTEGNRKATAYLAEEARKLGLLPAGDSGTYFQTVPLVRRTVAEGTSLSVGDTPLALWTDYLPLSFEASRPLDGAQAVYGGVFGDTAHLIPAAQAAGRLVVLASPPAGRIFIPRILPTSPLAGAAAVAVVGLDRIPPEYLQYFQAPKVALAGRTPAGRAPGPMILLITSRTAAALLGRPLAAVEPGEPGKTVRGRVVVTEAPAPVPARNVVAVLPGSDPKLKGEYVAIGAHNDHIGMTSVPVDHDSLRAYNDAVWEQRGRSPDGLRPSPMQLAAIRVNVDSLHRLRPTRLDSVNNGADDDGSGSVSVLEIAQAFARAPTRPKRSILFVWHTGEEKGLLGSEYFTDNPTVPRDSIVAQLNMDMVGRGDSTDIKGGGPNYLELVGSRRLSTELGDIVEAVNRTEPHPFTFDYTFDANGHPENIYCRSDHYMYARYGIPIVFFTTGLHQDYHQPTDEPQYIDYEHMARVDRLVYDVARTIANLDHRLMVDKEKPDPRGTCKQ